MKPNARTLRTPDLQHREPSPSGHGHPALCLNCGTALLGKFCHECGQNGHTHRMSFAHFLAHDVLHGVWHLDKGFPATLKKALVHPGREIRAYLAGKRVGYFNILTLILLLIAATGVVDGWKKDDGLAYNRDTQSVLDFIGHNAKWILLGLCFVFSWSSALVFRRARLNLSEHTVANAFFLIGLLVINLAEVSFSALFDTGTGLVAPVLMLAYLTWAYYGLFRDNFRFGGWLWRFGAHLLVSTVLVVTLLVASILVYSQYNGRQWFKFDTIHKTKRLPDAPGAPEGH